LYSPREAIESSATHPAGWPSERNRQAKSHDEEGDAYFNCGNGRPTIPATRPTTMASGKVIGSVHTCRPPICAPP
jgi:hypothetical protein